MSSVCRAIPHKICKVCGTGHSDYPGWHCKKKCSKLNQAGTLRWEDRQKAIEWFRSGKLFQENQISDPDFVQHAMKAQHLSFEFRAY